jgi:hypothetical protein
VRAATSTIPELARRSEIRPAVLTVTKPIVDAIATLERALQVQSVERMLCAPSSSSVPDVAQQTSAANEKSLSRADIVELVHDTLHSALQPNAQTYAQTYAQMRTESQRVVHSASMTNQEVRLGKKREYVGAYWASVIIQYSSLDRCTCVLIYNNVSDYCYSLVVFLCVCVYVF